MKAKYQNIYIHLIKILLVIKKIHIIKCLPRINMKMKIKKKNHEYIIN